MADYGQLIDRQRAFFFQGDTIDTRSRLKTLKALRTAIAAYEPKILAALRKDLNKSEFEAYTSEIGILLHEIGFVLKNLQKWVRPRKMPTALTHIGSRSYVQAEPYGVSLIIAPWNYPFQLAIAPLIGALAAGNCAIIKPSELTPATSEVIATIISETFPEEHVAVVTGDAETSKALLRERFDHIFFTGSTAIGRSVMQAAAQHLTPVTLELGGKSPCIVHQDADLKLAARRIAWGKFLNAGQTCVAPDHVFVHKSIKEALLEHLSRAIKDLYGAVPLESPHYTRIISQRHFNRLKAFLNEGKICIGGNCKEEALIMEPTILTDVDRQATVMQEEIFGPILPVMEYDDLDHTLQEIRMGPKPLALYLFTEQKAIQEKVIAQVSFGGGCINDTIFHLATPHLPFGGVGESGTGAYHGKSSFETFSHFKGILYQTTLFDLPFRYPNVKNGLKMIKMFLK